MLLLVILYQTGHTDEYRKLAQTGMKFLSVSTDARASAMGDAATSLVGNSITMFYNPSGMAYMSGYAEISLGRVEWIAGINYVFGSFAIKPENGRYGVYGLSLVSVDYGQFNGTIRDPGDKGYIDTGKFSPTAMSIGLGYAYAFSDRFSAGGNLKFVRQNLGTSIVSLDQTGGYVEKNYEKNLMAYDFGVLYQTGYKSLTFGMCIRNFAQEVVYEDEGFQLPLTFKIGLSLNLLDFVPSLSVDAHKFLFSVDAVHPRDYPEQLYLGVEYLFLKMFALRAGYATPNDENGLSAGIGFQQSLMNYHLSLDYAYSPFDLFNDVHRFTLNFAF